MSVVFKLAIAFLKEHPIRVVLTSIATIASVCMVVWVASSYDTILHTYDVYASMTFGDYPLSIAPISTKMGQPVPVEVMKQLREDPEVSVVEPMWVKGAKVRSANPKSDDSSEPSKSRKNKKSSKREREYSVLGLNISAPPFKMLSGTWISQKNAEAMEVVLSTDAAKRLKVHANDEIIVGDIRDNQRLKVIGVMDSPTVDVSYGSKMKILSPGIGELYVTTALAEKLFKTPAQISFLALALHNEDNLTPFRFGWAPRLSRFPVPVQFQEASDIEEALCETSEAENVAMQAYASTGISLLVALLVIFGTLNMGASERVRQFAILRAVALTRSKIAIMIAIEGFILATIGFVGGLTIGTGLVLLARDPIFMKQGIILGFNTVFLAAVAAFGGALLSSVIPAIRAIRVSPVEAMVPKLQLTGKGLPLVAVIVGSLLILVGPILTFVFPPEYANGVVITMIVGFSTMAIGFVLIAPAVVVFVDRMISPLLAKLLGIEPKLLVSQISSNLWRTVGAAISMTIGLGLFISIQVWGYTMMDAFVPGSWVPDAIINFTPDSVTGEEAAKVAKFPGVNPDKCLPLIVEQPRLLEDITNSAGRPSVTRQDNVIIIGFDPERAFLGKTPLLEVEWVNGSPAEAVPLLKQNRGCIVPSHFMREGNLKLGDEFTVVPPDNPSKPVTYSIAGSVVLPGWHWHSKFTGFRPRTHRAAALIFADYSTVSADFDLHGFSHVWFSYDPNGADKKVLEREAQSLYSGFLKQEVDIGRSQDKPFIRVVPVDDLRHSLNLTARKWLWIVSQLPLIALLVACLGVLNVIIASVRARRWSIGVLRSIGFTRSDLVKTVVAEGLLIGVVVCLLSLGFGVIAGWCGCGISQYISFFGGLHPSLVVPWTPVLLGLLAALVLATFTAIWPAMSIGKSEPLTLLQQGRSAF